VHLLGIASDAGVHGLMTHLYACLELCRREGVAADKVALHLLTDGRDTGPYTGEAFVQQVIAKCVEIGVGRVASVCGRYYAMDRDNRWERVQRAYACLTGIEAEKHGIATAPDAIAAMQRYYDKPTNDSQQGDEFIEPTIVADSPQAACASRISDGDTVIFYNYRGDRPREIVKAFVYDDAQWSQVPASPDTGTRGFDRGPRLKVAFVTLTAYEQGLPVQVAYPKPPKMTDIAGQFFADAGLRQFRCAETEKFPHVTFFFNDYREQPFPGESRQMAQSPQVPTYDLKPQMSAHEICDLVLARLAAPDCEDVIVVNFANGDMVGHTGKLDAAIAAVETVDGCVGRIVEATLQRGGALIVTADHGNAEQMFDPETSAPHTAHTLYPVECILVDPRARVKELASGSTTDASDKLRRDGRLADVMPTLIDMMGLKQPAAMTGRSLLR
jgi:2,3-bisphosphoglycerate-independent phosphoglycerate mutase